MHRFGQARHVRPARPVLLELVDMAAHKTVDPGRAVTRTISEFDGSGCVGDAGAIVALNGTAGIRAPSPVANTIDVPDVAGDGGVTTDDTAKFLCASYGI